MAKVNKYTIDEVVQNVNSSNICSEEFEFEDKSCKWVDINIPIDNGSKFISIELNFGKKGTKLKNKARVFVRDAEENSK